MNNKLKIGIAALIILVGLFFINQNNQKSYTSQSTSLFSISENDVKKILIQANQEAIELIKVDTTWSISGNDTLVVKDRSISQFFDKVLNLKLETLMTTKFVNIVLLISKKVVLKKAVFIAVIVPKVI